MRQTGGTGGNTGGTGETQGVRNALTETPDRWLRLQTGAAGLTTGVTPERADRWSKRQTGATGLTTGGKCGFSSYSR